ANVDNTNDLGGHGWNGYSADRVPAPLPTVQPLSGWAPGRDVPARRRRPAGPVDLRHSTQQLYAPDIPGHQPVPHLDARWSAAHLLPGRRRRPVESGVRKRTRGASAGRGTGSRMVTG